MSRSQESFNKKEVQKKKNKKRKEKEEKKLARKESGKSNFDDMIAYVDEFGQISTTPPDPDKKTEVNAEEIEVSVPQGSASDKKDLTRKGIVSFYNSSKGYGFIRDMETKQNIFVHISGLIEPINESDVVNFEITKGPKGLTAIKVKKHRNEV